MNVGGPADEGREIARVLTSALGAACAPGAPRETVALAREVAQMLSLEGLDRVLRVLEGDAGAPWPASLDPVLQRLARLSAAADAAGSLAVFTRADLELAGLAAELEAREWTPLPGDDASAPENTLGLADVVEGLPAVAGDDARALQRVRLDAPVAASLRAALDWLQGGETARRPLRVTAEDSMLELWVSDIDPAGLRPASEVLASVDGNLGPVGGAAPPGTWRVRVPAHAARASYLMLVQGGLGLALPWHAVIHVHLLPDDEVADAHPAAPALAPLAPLAEATGERPVVLVAHGLRRAWLVADRLVWRFPAERCEAAGPPPAPALDGQVRTDEGESWWRVDVARLLAQVEPLSVPSTSMFAAPPPASEPAPAAPAPAESRADARRAWTPRTPPAPGPVPPPRVEVIVSPPGAPARETAPPPRPPLRLLVSDDVQPLPAPEPPTLEADQVEPLAAPDVEDAPAPEPAPEPTSEPAIDEAFAIDEAISIDEAPAEPPAPEPAPPAPVAARPREPEPPPAEPAVRPRRALVAEDSLMAQLFLVRMLQHRGWFVEAVATAAALSSALRRGPWGAVCVDVELPDGRGAALLEGVRTQLERSRSAAALVALVRDPEDSAAARAAGVSRTLRKPFDGDELDTLLAWLAQVPGR